MGYHRKKKWFYEAEFETQKPAHKNKLICEIPVKIGDGDGKLEICCFGRVYRNKYYSDIRVVGLIFCELQLVVNCVLNK